MVTKLELKLFVIFMFYIQGGYQYQNLLSKYYDSTINCQNELQSNWNVIGGSSFPNYSCQISCSLGSYTYTSFQLDQSSYPNGFEINKSIIQPASVLGYDLVFYVAGQFSVQILGDNQVLDTQVLQQQTYCTFPQENLYLGINCLGTTFQSIYASIYIQGSNFSTFKLQFKNLPLNYGFFKILMWTNCVLNCDQCQDSTNCSSCLQGFTLMVMPSGQQVCSQQEGCSKSNCLECTKSGITEVCINCQPGYSLDNSNNCVSNGSPCSPGQYRYTDNTCQFYSNTCLMQSTGSSTWVSCYQVPDQTAIKCPSNQLILLYERGNYNTRVCGCNHFAYCEQCNQFICTKCITGYIFNGLSCSLFSCPQGYYLNQLTKLCNPQLCKDPQCQKCDQYVCYQCASAKYYVDGSNPAYCKECSVNNCQQCNMDGTCKICDQGYYPSQGSCFSCLNNCMICSNSQTCQTCINNYTLSSDKTSCTCSVKNCFQCSPTDGSACQTCLNGSLDSITKTCKCSVQNCSLCNQNTESSCQQCLGLYTKDINNLCQCPIKNCSVCNQNGDQCITCTQGYQLSNRNTQCTCSIQNCLQCSQTDGQICQVCLNGSFDVTSKTCKCSVKNCSLCNQDTNSSCQQCVGLYLKDNNNQCQCPIQNCSICNQYGDQCLSCVQGYQLSNQNTQCKCSVQNCLQCSQTDGAVCQICQNGSFDLTLKACICSVQNCSLCIQNYNSQCQQCVGSYIKDSNNQCQCPIKNCFACNTNGDQCLTCVQGYQLSNGNTECSCSVQNCLQCNQTDGSICQNCQYGSFDEITKTCKCSVQNCLLCSQNSNSQCELCASKFIKDTNNQCQCPIKNCSVCSQDGDQCLTCTQGYKLTNNNTQCDCSIQNCSLCSQTDGSICQDCQNGSFDSTTKTCQCSVLNCSLCQQNTDSQCQQCMGLYFKDNNSQCQCPIKNCATCNSNGDKCLTCIQGYQISNGNTECVCSVQNCLQCSQIDGSVCLNCQNGYYNPTSKTCECLVQNCSFCDQNNNSSCQKCSGLYLKDRNNQCQCPIQNCSKCNSNGDQCELCIQGYSLSNGGTQCNCSVQDCLQCSKTDGTICQNCKQGSFDTSSKSCQCNVQNCNQCNSNDDSSCMECSGLYIKDKNNKCQCPIANCAQCNQNGDQCLTCINGYSLNKSNTQCNCSVQNCKQCSQQDGTQCLQCQPGYTNQGSVNSSSSCNCSVLNCEACNLNDGSICENCQNGFELSYNKKECLCNQPYCQLPQTCDVQMCKQCNLNSKEICSVCQDSYILTSDFKCALGLENDFSVEQNVTQNIGYNVTITFRQQLITSQEDLQNSLNLQILDYDNPFVVNILSIKDQQISAQIQLKENCKNKNLIVKFDNNLFMRINNLQDNQKEVKLKEYIILTQNQVAQAQQTGEITKGAANTLLITMILTIIIGNTYVLFSTIDLTTFIYFLQFFDVRHPQNLLSFCSIFQNFQFAFVPNTIQLYLIEPNYVQPTTPQKFLDNGYDAYFFNGAGQSYTIITSILTIYGIIKILSCIPILSVKLYIESKIKSGWEYSGFLDLIGCVYVYVLVSSLCQFYCFQFDEPLAFINYTFFAISFIFVFLAPLMMAIFIKNCQNLNDPQIQQQFGSLIGGLVVQIEQNNSDNNLTKVNHHNINNIQQETSKSNINKNKQDSNISKQQKLQLKWSKYTNVLLYLRKIIYIMTLLYLYGQVYIQVIVICIMNIFLAYFYLYIKPLQEKNSNLKNGVSEIIIIFMQTAICFLVEDKDDQDEQQRYDIGWFIIACASTILIIHIFSVVVDLIRGILSQISFKQLLQNTIKASPKIPSLFQQDSSRILKSQEFIKSPNLEAKEKVEDYNRSHFVNFDIQLKQTSVLSQDINLNQDNQSCILEQKQNFITKNIKKTSKFFIQSSINDSQSQKNQSNQSINVSNSDLVLFRDSKQQLF
ncbi:hypothetical protein ABPG74_000814 [Tetrahymena malaccensis]